MPERKIQVTEYKCTRCSYQWISRVVNEKYKQFAVGRYRNEWNDDFYSEYKPSNCPRCKTSLWNRRHYSSEEKSLIAKLTRGKLRGDMFKVYEKVGRYGNNLSYVCRNFLYNMQPTVSEFYKAMYIDGKEDYRLGLSGNEIRKKRQDIMLEILKSHGIIITPEDIAKDRAKEIKLQEDFDERVSENMRIKSEMEGMGLDSSNPKDRETYFNSEEYKKRS